MAEEEQEGGRSFRVNDRRRFSPITGEPRSEEQAQSDQNPASSPSRQESEAAHPSSSEASRADRPPPSDQSAPHATHAASGEISFSSFLLGLSTQALMYMGEVPPAPGQPVQTDLAAAQQLIDVLAMLKQKTTGNLESSEEAMLQNVLFDLRMRYVDLTKKSRPAPHEKTSE